jgi:hypothetical protein
MTKAKSANATTTEAIDLGAAAIEIKNSKAKHLQHTQPSP